MEQIAYSIHHDNDCVFLTLSGRMTNNTAPEVEQALAQEVIGNAGMSIDIHGLEYISSFGLRVLMNQLKRCKGKEFHIVGASPEVMDIFEVTGFSEIMDIQPARRQVSVEGCSKIGAGACGECFRLDEETIIKLYYPRVKMSEIEEEKKLAKKAFVLGVPTAISYDIVECEGRVGVVYELLNSKTLSELIREDREHIDRYIHQYADVCRQVHEIEAEDGSLPSFMDINRADIPNVSYITDEERDYLYRFLDLVPKSNHCVHGDLNINNIMVQNGECCLIDMGEFSIGNPMFDLSRVVFSMKYAPYYEEEIDGFYKLPHDVVTQILNDLLLYYFDGTTDGERLEKYPESAWIEPMAWFRCCTSMLKGTRWKEEKRELALSLLREKLIPFIQSREK